MARPRSAPDFYLLSKVSTLYHLRNQTQEEIAHRLRISRPTVSRLLREARDRGIVQITVAPPRGLHLELETQLEERYGLEAVHIVEMEESQPADMLRHQLGAAAARYLARTVQAGDHVGLAWGTTLSAMVQAMSPLPTTDTRVVQTLGGIGPPDAEAYAGDLVRRLAQLLGAAPVLLPAPGVVATAEVRDVLREDPHVASALRHLDRLDVVYLGVGSLRTNPVLNDGTSVPHEVVAELRDAGAVGDMALRFFDAAGRPLSTALDDRLLGVSMEQLRQVPRVVAVAGGADKLEAIGGALRVRVIDVLITDRATAQGLAAEEPSIQR